MSRILDLSTRGNFPPGVFSWKRRKFAVGERKFEVVPIFLGPIENCFHRFIAPPMDTREE